jgi:hypothetical protein
MVRLALSSGNTQPWRVFFDDTTNEFHFFKKEKCPEILNLRTLFYKV